MMEKIVVVHYPKCSTCQKATKWLKENNIDFESRHIVENTPTEKELTDWIQKSNLPVSKFFNTSGKIYKEKNIKEKVKKEPVSDLIKLLASEGMLIKRPILVTKDNILVGFNEEEWGKALK